LAALEGNPSIAPTEIPAKKASKASEVLFASHAEQEEFEVFRGLLAKNPNASDRQLLDLWKAVTGKERETQKVINKFWEYLREARGSLDL